MKDKLEKLCICGQKVSLSGIIVKVLSMIAPVVKREHLWGDQRESRYTAVCDDPEEVREHVHVYFPEDVYRELKLLHQDLNVFSIAQLLREFLRFFLDFMEEHGENVSMVLKRLFEYWKEESNSTQLSPREILRQLQIFSAHLTGQKKIITIYNREFSPFKIYRL
ncbi:MAG: hypothetical protein JXJ04_23035 [Spirochaetales bacterium]|nr:hypothetical protein [Spirochaetales bacterium]